jgi:hypothetical protein
MCHFYYENLLRQPPIVILIVLRSGPYFANVSLESKIDCKKQGSCSFVEEPTYAPQYYYQQVSCEVVCARGDESLH